MNEQLEQLDKEYVLHTYARNYVNFTKGINATLINPRFVSGIDEEMLESLKKDHKLVVTIEDGCVDGGFGERISRYYGPSEMKTICFGVRKALYDRYDVEQLLRDNHLTEEQIVVDVLNLI